MAKLQLCLDKREWDDYIIDNGGHPLQLWGWGDVKANHGWRAHRLFMRNDEDCVVGAVQVLIRKLPWPLRSLTYVPRGPVVGEGNRDELLNDLSDFIRKNWHSVAVMIEPDEVEYFVPQGWRKSENRILPANTIILDLKKSDAELLAVMAKKTRQYIRKSASEDIQIRPVRDKAELAKCLAIYHETAKRAKFELHRDQYYYDVFDKMGDFSMIFASYYQGEPIAFLWLVISADTAFELYGGMNEKGQELRANYALKWHAIRKCKEWEMARYDFGGLIDGGVATFKKNWTDVDIQLAGTYEYPLSPVYSVWRKGLPAAKSIMRRIKATFKR